MRRDDESDLTTRSMARRLHSVRFELYRQGEITVAGLRRLDAAIGLSEDDTYRLVRAEVNR